MRAINDLLARLDQSIGAQKHFLADAAHQLKTPLAGLRTQAELAQREIDAGQHDPQALKRVAAADRALEPERGAHGQPAAGDGARRGRGAGACASSAVNLARLATRDGARLRAARARASASTSATKARRQRRRGRAAGPRSSASALLLRELIRNLVDNALQYTPAGGTVTVRVIDDPFGQVVVLQVEDSGPGIAAGRARAGVPAVLPLARHRRRRLRPRPGDRARDRAPARRRDHARPMPTPAPPRPAPGARSGEGGRAAQRCFTVRFPRRAGALSSAPAAGSSRSTSGCRGPGRA